MTLRPCLRSVPLATQKETAIRHSAAIQAWVKDLLEAWTKNSQTRAGRIKTARDKRMFGKLVRAADYAEEIQEKRITTDDGKTRTVRCKVALPHSELTAVLYEVLRIQNSTVVPSYTYTKLDGEQGISGKITIVSRDAMLGSIEDRERLQFNVDDGDDPDTIIMLVEENESISTVSDFEQNDQLRTTDITEAVSLASKRGDTEPEYSGETNAPSDQDVNVLLQALEDDMAERERSRTDDTIELDVATLPLGISRRKRKAKLSPGRPRKTASAIQFAKSTKDKRISKDE